MNVMVAAARRRRSQGQEGSRLAMVAGEVVAS